MATVTVLRDMYADTAIVEDQSTSTVPCEINIIGVKGPCE
jgi:hypothetical protein